jgi:hypothetical protein
MADEQKYQRGEPDEWRSSVAALKVREIPGAGGHRAFEIAGPCPRCQHSIRKDVSYVFGPALALSGQRESVTVRVVCNCTAAHEGAPAGVAGCGAEGGVELTFS